MKKIILLLGFTILSLSAYSQSDSKKAFELGREAIREIESGNIEPAIELLEQAQKLDPDNIDYPYEIAYAHYLDKDYKAAIKILKGLTKHGKVNDLVYQMLGNAYDMDKKPSKAIKTYEAGLKQFPSSGRHYLERGNMELMAERYSEAMGYYEAGIERAPAFPSNYYWASKLYMNSNNEVWGLLYGELFINLERNSARTAEISKLLYDTYKNGIVFESDSEMTISLCQSMSLNMDEMGEGKDLKLPFCMVYEPTMLLSIAFTSSITFHSLDTIRTGFLKNYYAMGHHKTHPNVLFDYQRKIQEAGHLEAYNHWLMLKGDEQAFALWHESNQEKWEAFVEWFTDNPLKLSDDYRFHRRQY